MRPSVGRAPNTTGRGQWPWVALELPCGPLVLYLSIYLFMKLVTNRKRASCVALWLVRLLTFVEQKKKKKKKRKTAGRITKTDSSAGLGPVGCRAYSTANKQDNQRSSGAGGSKTPDEAAHISQQATPRRQRSQRRGTREPWADGNCRRLTVGSGAWPWLPDSALQTAYQPTGPRSPLPVTSLGLMTSLEALGSLPSDGDPCLKRDEWTWKPGFVVGDTSCHGRFYQWLFKAVEYDECYVLVQLVSLICKIMNFNWTGYPHNAQTIFIFFVLSSSIPQQNYDCCTWWIKIHDHHTQKRKITTIGKNSWRSSYHFFFW